MGWAAFMCISPNVKEEGAMKEDTGTQDTPYTEVGARLRWQELHFLSFARSRASRCVSAVQDTLVEQLKLCVDYLWKSERYELIADINKPVIAVFEKRRDFKVSSTNAAEPENESFSTRVFVRAQRLSELYYDIHRSYLKVTEVVNSEKRLFGRYYRVAFYGQVSLGL